MLAVRLCTKTKIARRKLIRSRSIFWENPELSRIKTYDWWKECKPRKATPPIHHTASLWYQVNCYIRSAHPPQPVKNTGHQPKNAKRTQQTPQTQSYHHTQMLAPQNAQQLDAQPTVHESPTLVHQNVASQHRTGACVANQKYSSSEMAIEIRPRH